MLICVTAALAVAGSAALAADIALRNDLRPRLAQLWPIYGAYTNTGRNEPIVRSAAADQGVYYGEGLQILQVSGIIEQGDTDRLADLIGPPDTVSSFVVVFDSPGGNFLEGVKLGEYLRPFRGGNGDPALNGVVVLDGNECMSACAVAFALAAYPRDSGNSVRFVEMGARLGFHMPFVPGDQQAVQTEVSRAMDLTYQIMSEYVQLIGNGIAPPALVQNALYYRRPTEFFLLTGGLMTRFMDFVPVAGPVGGSRVTLSGLTQRDAVNMCQILAYSQGRDMTAGDYEFWPVHAQDDHPDDTPLVDLFREFGSDRISMDGCTIDRLEGDNLGIYGQGFCERESYGGGWCGIRKGPYGLYPGYGDPLPRATGALLADSLGCHGGTLTRAYYHWGWRNDFLEEEDPDSYRWEEETDPDAPLRQLDWSGARLGSNLNIRSQPGGDRVARWSEGTPVQVLDCALSADDQGVWYQVLSGGVTGWASARYVDVPALAGWDFMIRPAGD